MSEIHKKDSKDVVEETVASVAEQFEAEGVPAPQEYKKPKPSKTEQRLIHVGVDHLYMGVFQHLLQAQAELKALVEKKDDERAKTLKGHVDTLLYETESVINALAKDVEAMPNVEGIQELLKKLVQEVELANALAIVGNVPKEQMH